MKEWAEAIVSALDRHTAALDRLVAVIENNQGVSPENTELMKFFNKGHIPTRMQARVGQLLLWLAGSSEYPRLTFNRNSIYYPQAQAIKYYEQVRDGLKLQGFENSVVTTPEGLAQLFSSGFLDRALIPGIGPATLSAIKSGLKQQGYL